VPQRVVDQLEVVEVEVEQRELAALAAGLGEVAAELLLEHRSVGQAGQRVVVSQEGDLSLGLAPLGHVLPRAQYRNDPAFRVGQDSVAPRDYPVVPGAGLNHRLQALCRRLDAGDKAEKRQARLQARGLRDDRAEPVLPDQLGGLEAQQVTALLVDQLHATALVQHDDQRAGHLQVALSAVALLAQLMLGLHRARDVVESAHAPAVGPESSGDRAGEHGDPALPAAGLGAPEHAADGSLGQRRPGHEVVIGGDRLALGGHEHPVRHERGHRPLQRVWLHSQDDRSAGVPADRPKLRVGDHHPFFEALDHHPAQLLGRSQRLTGTVLEAALDHQSA